MSIQQRVYIGGAAILVTAAIWVVFPSGYTFTVALVGAWAGIHVILIRFRL